MLSSLIVIEVISTNHPEISKKIMVDASDEMSLLMTRIRNVCEYYKKLSGLNGLCVKNLKKKTENGYLDLEEDWLIGNYIQSKDVICFELSFSEIWLDIKMNLEKNNSFTTQFSLELKVVLNSDKKEFENTLIYLGITCMAKLVENDGDYYSFTQLIVDYPLVCSKCPNTCKVYFEHDSKLTCTLKFTNITEVVAKRVLTENCKANNVNTITMSARHKGSNYFSFSKAVNDISKVNKVKKNFNYFFEGYIKKLGNITEYNHIIWKHINDEYVYEDNNSSFFCNESRTSRLSNPINIGAVHKNIVSDDDNSNNNNNKTEMILYNANNCETCNRSASIEMNLIIDSSLSERSSTNSNHNGTCNNDYFPYKYLNINVDDYGKHEQGFPGHKTSNKTINQDMKKLNQKFQSDYNYTQIDYVELLNKYCENYIHLADFKNRSPYTRNLTEVNSDSAVNDDSDRIYHHGNNARNRNSVNTLNNAVHQRDYYRIAVCYMHLKRAVNSAMEYKYVKQITLAIIIMVLVVIGFTFI